LDLSFLAFALGVERGFLNIRLLMMKKGVANKALLSPLSWLGRLRLCFSRLKDLRYNKLFRAGLLTFGSRLLRYTF
jgi:hypothetical protein